MTEGVGHNSDGALLNTFVERIEDAERDKRHHAELIKEIKQEAKAAGLKPKLIGQIVRQRLETDAQKQAREADESDLEIYRRWLNG